MPMRQLSPIDNLINHVDRGMRSVFNGFINTSRAYPAASLPEPELTDQTRKHTAGLMRINHTGEVCAQALYQGHALTSRCPTTKQQMELAAEQEVDHLVWCEQRLRELRSQPSRLNPLWYVASLAIGVVAGMLGDRWNLGFVEETEHQVIRHLESHLEELADDDEKSRVLLEQLRDDEAHHADTAHDAGAAPLPAFIKLCMHWTAKIMTKTAYRV